VSVGFSSPTAGGVGVREIFGKWLAKWWKIKNIWWPNSPANNRFMKAYTHLICLHLCNATFSFCPSACPPHISGTITAVVTKLAQVQWWPHYSCVQLFCSCVAEPAFNVASASVTQPVLFLVQYAIFSGRKAHRPTTVTDCDHGECSDDWSLRDISNYCHCISVRVHDWSRPAPLLVCLTLMASLSHAC